MAPHVGHGEIQVADYTNTDRDGPPAHSHPWDEVQIVVDGQVEFLLGDSWHGGGSGTVQLLPVVFRILSGCQPGRPGSCGYRSVRHMTASPEIWPRLFAAGAPMAEIVEAAGRHGVQLG